MEFDPKCIKWKLKICSFICQNIIKNVIIPTKELVSKNASLHIYLLRSIYGIVSICNRTRFPDVYPLTLVKSFPIEIWADFKILDIYNQVKVSIIKLRRSAYSNKAKIDKAQSGKAENGNAESDDFRLQLQRRDKTLGRFRVKIPFPWKQKKFVLS